MPGWSVGQWVTTEQERQGACSHGALSMLKKQTKASKQTTYFQAVLNAPKIEWSGKSPLREMLLTWVCVCVLGGRGGRLEEQSSNENACAKTQRWKQSSSKVQGIFLLVYSSIYPAELSLSTFYETNTRRDIKIDNVWFSVLLPVSLWLNARQLHRWLWYRNIKETQFCLSCSLTPHSWCVVWAATEGMGLLTSQPQLVGASGETTWNFTG